ncbi:MAG: hypothetical protein H6519_08890 [Microthrixaceae bacterium]|nr:hypothetical protein [Acidimicrobiales bacterium]MCB9404535.1 hypothetical protein [Microthrixaceae bacterium]
MGSRRSADEERDVTSGQDATRGEQIELILSTRQARRIVAVVFAGMLMIGGVAWWLMIIPYDSGGPTPITCGAVLDEIPGEIGREMLEGYRKGCADEWASRRNTALLIGGLVVVMVTVVSTWPSGRLTHGPDGSEADGDRTPGDPDGTSELERLGLVDTEGRLVPSADSPAKVGPDSTGTDQAVPEGPASELIRLGLIDLAELVDRFDPDAHDPTSGEPSSEDPTPD